MAAISKLVRWLPKAVEATADDIARFGPQAGRVRSLLNFLPTMSDEAALVSNNARRSNVLRTQPIYDIANKTAFDVMENANRYEPWNNALNAATDWRNRYARLLSGSAGDASVVEAVNDIIDPQTYRILTNPLAAGRAVDLLRTRPRYQGTPFLDVVQNLAGRGAIAGPRDVVRAGRIARSPEDVRETALTLIADGMSPADALRAARML
jgi:hypothetical protein